MLDAGYYAMASDEICGFRQIHEREGQVELVLYFHQQTPSHARLLFQGLFEKLLHRRPKLQIEAYPALDCTHCGYRQPRENVIRRIRQQRTFVRCDDCDLKIPLPDVAAGVPLGRQQQLQLDQAQLQTALRTLYEASLVPVKRLAEQARTDGGPAPVCFISYAWVLELGKHLRNAGLAVLLDQWHNTAGTSITEFVDRIEAADRVLVVGTPELQQKYSDKDRTSVVGAELRLISQRLRGPRSQREAVIPLLLQGPAADAFPPQLRDSAYLDFGPAASYFVVLFDLVLSLHGIAHDHPGVQEQRESLAELSRRGR